MARSQPPSGRLRQTGSSRAGAAKEMTQEASSPPPDMCLANGDEASTPRSEEEMPATESPRRNKRKNFQPRNIVYREAEYDSPVDSPVDLSRRDVEDDPVMDLSTSRDHTPTAGVSRSPPTSSSTPTSLIMDYAESTMKELLGIYGLSEDSAGQFVQSRPPPPPPLTFQNYQAGSPLSYLRRLTTDQTPRHSVCPPSSTSSSPGTPGNAGHVQVLVSPLPPASMPAQQLAPSIRPEVAKPNPVDYSRYVKRFSSALDCGSPYCSDLSYREHFHCLDCNSKVFVKKEEMIRHFKWHKKRDESLQHGFMRYSPMDDCGDRFSGCTHNRKQTHYHCLKEGCDKVYISTSDVQMHANYHRKDSAIIQEGFQRFRATEDCSTPSCLFFSQRTTHFHCRRPGCSFTFKNKADMEKHKTHHIKDEQLNKDGFKKFMKHEACSFDSCRFSRVCNHIHCIRPGCSYVLHSSSQLYSHKRKHERRDNEIAYGRYKMTQNCIRSDSVDLQSQIQPEQNGCHSPPSAPDTTTEHPEASMAKYLSRSTQPCIQCDSRDHFQCRACDQTLHRREEALQHAYNHELQEQVSDAFYACVDGGPGPVCPPTCRTREKHFHCGWLPVASQPLFNNIKMPRQENLSPPIFSFGSFLPPYGVPPSLLMPPQPLLPLPPSQISLPSCDDSSREQDLDICNDPICGPSSHYHCPQSRCRFVTESAELLAEHAKEFHEQTAIPEGFCYFERSAECGLQGCPHNGRSAHFHCTRCGVSTLQPSTHDHRAEDEAASEARTVKATGTFYPLGAELSHLLQQPPTKPAPSQHPLFGPSQNCGRPFCKLKRRDHFHCNICNQTFPGFSWLRMHYARHSGAGSPVPLYPPGYVPHSPSSDDISSDSDRPLEDAAPWRPVDDRPAEDEAKKMKLSLRLLKDEPVPEGYIRFRFNEDCGYGQCGYREHQTHFHCTRRDCGYSFCDKTRFVQHTARHERLDTLMGGDFRQFRGSVSCGKQDCVHSANAATANKSSHFHCLKCDFVCTDTNKVVAHRRQHAKMDSITAAGFEKFTPAQHCGIQGCNHNQRQTHYHCLKCQYTVLGLTQMSSHKYRHLENIN